MSDVLESVEYLLGEHSQATGHGGDVPWRARRTLETGMFVTYARPFTGSRGLQKLDRAPELSPDLVETHAQIVDLRHTVYAHSDDTPFRQLRRPDGLEEVAAWPEDLAAWVREPGARFEEEFLEQWLVPMPPMLEAIRALAVANRAHFAVQIDQIIARLRLDAVSPTSGT